MKQLPDTSFKENISNNFNTHLDNENIKNERRI